MSARCGSCEQPIQWVRTSDTGRPIPLDPGVAPNGRVWIKPDGTARFLSADEQARAVAKGGVTLRQVHHVTCPSVERHRGVSRQQTALDLFGGAA